MTETLQHCSFVIPCYNEAENLQLIKENIQRLEQNGAEVIIVDGGSSDGSFAQLQALPNTIRSAKGRATQMNAGAAKATKEMLCFLHADTKLPEGFAEQFSKQTRPKPVRPKQEAQIHWGFCQVSLDSPKLWAQTISFFINLRSLISKVATGDMLIFIDKQMFEQSGGYQDIPLMEDIALTKQLRKQAKPVIIGTTITTSARRWQKNGVITTVLLMWRLRLLYFLGVSPEKLRRKYYG